VKLLPWIGLAAAVLLASCGRPVGHSDAGAPPATPLAPVVERVGPVRWNAATGTFELNGKPLKTEKLWTFDGSTEGFTAVDSTVAPAPAPGQGLSVRIAGPVLRSPSGLNVSGSRFPLVLVRLTRTAAGQGWDGALYYVTASHGETAGFVGKPVFGADPALNETTTLVYDMSRQAAGAPDWKQSAIDQIRLDLEDTPGGAFTILQVAMAENPGDADLAPPVAGKPAKASAPLVLRP
jgi:hypothetical protein